jgi:hypothetical protein
LASATACSPIALARRGVEEGRRRLLDHLLVAALDRAFALVQVDAVAVLSPSTWISMWRGLGDELLDEDAVVAEGDAASFFEDWKPLARLLVAPGDAHALAAAAGAGLDHHRIADLARRSSPPRRRPRSGPCSPARSRRRLGRASSR